MTIIDGRYHAEDLLNNLKKRISKLKNIIPKFVIILLGNNYASQIYVNNKIKTASKIGIIAELIKLPDITPEKELLKIIDAFNNDKLVHGMIVQMPIPSHINQNLVISKIDPEKDIDGFHPVNAGKLYLGQKALYPCTAIGCLYLIDKTLGDITGKKAVVVGRSFIVGKPVAALLLQANATVTICHYYTKDLKSITITADIVVIAIGKAKYFDRSYFKKTATILDVGINYLRNNMKRKIVGDVDFDDVYPYVENITPVPGGVGPMTVAYLLHNVILAAENLIFFL